LAERLWLQRAEFQNLDVPPFLVMPLDLFSFGFVLFPDFFNKDP
jgi:hypothetical protein